MSILLLLIPLSVLFVVVGGVAFFWAANRRQFDNVDAAAFLPMIDSDLPPAEPVDASAATAGQEEAGPAKAGWAETGPAETGRVDGGRNGPP